MYADCNNKEPQVYSVAMVDVRQEMEYWPEWAALASAAHLARYSISCVISTIATL